MKVFIAAFFIIVFTNNCLGQVESKVFSLNTIIKSQEFDDHGFLWMATETNLWRYDGYNIQSLDQIYHLENPNEFTQISDMIYVSGFFLVSTKKNGIFKITSNQVQQVQSGKLSEFEHLRLLTHDNWTWSVSNEGLIKFNDNSHEIFGFEQHDEYQSDGYFLDTLIFNDQIFIVKTNQLISFSIKASEFTFHKNTPDSMLRSINFFDNQFYLSTDSGVFVSSDLITWVEKYPQLSTKKIKKIIKRDDQIWVVTILDGIYRIDTQTSQFTHYSTKAVENFKLTSNFVTDVMVDNNKLLWVFHFNGAVDKLDLKKESWGLNKFSDINECPVNESILKFAETPLFLWVISQSAIYKVNKSNQLCFLVLEINRDNQAYSDSVPSAIIPSLNNTVLLGTSNGIYEINSSNEVSVVNTEIEFINFIESYDSDQYLIGAFNGLYLLDGKTYVFKKIDKSSGINFVSAVRHNQSNKIYLASDKGVYHLDGEKLIFDKNYNQKIENASVFSISIIQDDLFVGTRGFGLHQFNLKNDEHKRWVNKKLSENVSIKGIIPFKNDLWLSSNEGLFKINPFSERVQKFTDSMGLQSNMFVNNAMFLTSENKILVGGVNGYNYFDPKKVQQNYSLPMVNISKIKRFNKPLLVNDLKTSFVLDTEINQMQNIELSYKDYIISFEISSSDFTSPSENSFKYRLFPFESDWNIVGADQRQITYTNLPSNQFDLQLLTSNLDGSWGTQIKTLKIKVLPPPWLSWWAITAYVFAVLLAIYIYIQYKIKSNRLLAERLQIEVAEKTNELNIQKQTVESLLEKKNELFSNVSHEFRTPLTLILGPIKELLNKQHDNQDVRTLTMINRNANRLLSLVEQLLQIARVSNLDKVKTKPQKTSKQVSSLVESFEHMAQNKRIKLSLQTNESATIDVTEQFIDAVLGNLLSNAIKYTQSGGSVWITATTSHDTFLLTVKDTGSGLTEDQQKDIFKRFKRLESHQDIEGIGIGLSVVEEVVKINHGTISVTSELGLGSEFMVRVPLSDALEIKEEANISTLVNQLQKESQESNHIEEYGQESKTNSNAGSDTSVLIIEDNNDMRQHIVDIVSPHYICLTAVNGTKGVAKAIEEVPDIIISDVMMPEMDGFKVARIIRSDERTSHIPLMLLTALNDKTSRIKGWRENVDAYMTKPFDRDELLVQLENMLTIRDILKQKAGQELKSGKPSGSTLPKKDQEFVDKLMLVIEKNYMDPILNRNKIASKLAVSDRQLQRKIKALIDLNPMDMLREFRLNKAKEMLRDGYQVSQVADECGFNSLSYFSQCFKAQFGMSPKRFQNTG